MTAPVCLSGLTDVYIRCGQEQHMSSTLWTLKSPTCCGQYKVFHGQVLGQVLLTMPPVISYI